MSDRIRVRINRGIVSSGANTVNIINNTVQAAPPISAAKVASPPRVRRLRSTTAATRLFVGRENELAALAKTLKQRSGVIAQTLTGLGGIGKSTLAEQYVQTQGGRHNPIWWIDAEDPAQIEAGLAALARRLHPGNPPDRPAEWAKAWLASHKGWLVILDNVTRPPDVAELIGSLPGGRFLVTSRQTVGWESIAAPIRLGVLPTRQAVKMLRLRVGDRDLLDGAEELCRALGGLPLAIAMAGHYITQNHITADTYRQRLIQDDGAVLDWTHAGGDIDRTVTRTWRVTLDRITAEHGPQPERILRTLAWYAPDDIPIGLLSTVPEADEAVSCLVAYGLVTRDGDALSIHRLVQAVSRAAEGRPLAGQMLLTAWTGGTEPSARLFPHLAAFASWGGLDGLDEGSAELAIVYGVHLANGGSSREAIEFLDKTVAGARERPGFDHLVILHIREVLAVIRATFDSSDATIDEFAELLADQQRVLGPRHLETLETRLRLGDLYTRREEYPRAIAHYRHLARDAELALGRDHSLTLQTKWDLAWAYLDSADSGDGPRIKDAKDLLLALSLWREFLAGLQRTLGPDDRTTIEYAMEIGKHLNAFALTPDPLLRSILNLSRGAAGARRLDNVRRIQEISHRLGAKRPG
ncbi:tetratricopeptide repeat protein [Nonomuraea aurantiaca]|uniref:tetratricopeptide repeat protein n=1 Tax=Nonomuraea aurantiaca TaxID=2878562 RepID=UPI001CD9F625|nr:tetratricopeptide repeat protein [Nonomuraea aurantiaca]MCA2224216.1 hypothetical protein [Nonomuraea aurantiaca]